MDTAKQLADACNATLIGSGQNIVKRISTDSRTLIFPEETAFVALKTSKADGHKYIAPLYNRGVRTFIISDQDAISDSFVQADFILVANTRDALQKIAAQKRAQYTKPVVGITGSNGKTTVKEWINEMMRDEIRICRSPRSFNSQIGVPLSVWNINNDSDIAIFEAGISQIGEMERLEAIIRPTIGIFTSLGEAHSQGFLSQREKCTEKIKLFKDSQTIIYNKDNKLVDICMRQAFAPDRLFSFGADKDADLRVLSVNSDKGHTKVSLSSADLQSLCIEIPMTDAASVENALVCVAFLLKIGIAPEKIAEKLMRLEPVEMRLELKEGNNGCIIIDDTYNSDIDSLTIALDQMKTIAAQSGKTPTLIISDLLQTSMSQTDLYTDVAKITAEKGVRKIIGIGRNISQRHQLFSQSDKCFYQTTDDFLRLADLSDFKNEVILIKGSRDFHLEEVSNALAAAVHETVLEVNLSALERNLAYFKSHLSPSTKLISMVKANAYGSGDVEVARALQRAGADMLAVAVADEGETLRKADITLPIIVMNPEPNSFAKIFAFGLEPEIYNFSLLRKMITESEKNGLTHYPFHLKIDTGMHRLGFDPDDIDRVVEILKGQDYISPRSVFSHFVGSDSPALDYFTHEQVRRFEIARKKIKDAFGDNMMAHICNSAGIERFPQYHFDAVRLGIGHYGMSAVASDKLEEVCTLKTKILQVRNVPKEETVGYSRKGTLHRDSVIGAIPIGYADGLDRHLGNRRGQVLVKGRLVPIIGNVCMDVTMIDLTDTDAKEGDEVVIFGKGNPIATVAEKLDTITYEVLSGIARRVKRIYVRE